MRDLQCLPAYDLVTLLIGVNNQYRGQPVTDYRPQFEDLLKSALRPAGRRRLSRNDPRLGLQQPAGCVFVLSIPDWGVTPFAKARFAGLEPDRLIRISAEIDAYNEIARAICRDYTVEFIDITEAGRRVGTEPSGYAEDGLHLGCGQLKTWAAALTAHVMDTVVQARQSTQHRFR